MSASKNKNHFPNTQEIENLFPNLDELALISKTENSCIYHAEDSSNNREVAIKVFPKDLSSDEEYVTLFNKELEALKKIRNKSIAKIYDFGEVNGHLFITMEFVDGKPMHDSIDGDVIETITATQIMNNVCLGLDAAHTKNIIHRDISPHNILLDPETKPKIINFGFAKNLYTSDEDTWGKSGYTAPEAIEDPEKSDKRSDVYSTGIILKQMLTGAVAPEFTKNSAGNEIASKIPKALQSIIDRATSKSASSRYSSAGTMGLVLREAIEDIEDSEGGLKTATPAHLANSVELKTAAPANKNKLTKTNSKLATAPRIKAETSPVPQSSYAPYHPKPNTTKSSSALYAFLLVIILGGIPLLIYVSKNSSTATPPITSSDTNIPEPVISSSGNKENDKQNKNNKDNNNKPRRPSNNKNQDNSEVTVQKEDDSSDSNSGKTIYGTSSGVIAPFAPTK